MNVISKIKSTKEMVSRLLVKYEHYRDSDEKLVAHIWKRDLLWLQKDSENDAIIDFLVLYANGKITAADVITRARRKIQEEQPELRGQKWAERQREEKDVRQNINERNESFPNM